MILLFLNSVNFWADYHEILFDSNFSDYVGVQYLNLYRARAEYSIIFPCNLLSSLLFDRVAD